MVRIQYPTGLFLLPEAVDRTMTSPAGPHRSTRLKVAISCPDIAGLGGGVKHGLLLAKPLAGLHDITIFHRPGAAVSNEALRNYGVDIGPVTFRSLNHEHCLRRLTRGYDLFLNVSYASLARASARKNILLVFFPVPADDIAGPKSLRDRFRHGKQRLQVRMLELVDSLDPNIEDRSFTAYRKSFGAAAAGSVLPLFLLRKIAWSGGLPHRLGHPALDDYDVILANSAYTARWTERYYGKTCTISYPPIDTGSFAPREKEKLILSVGRFEPERMSKRHDALVAVFRQLHDADLLPGWKLVICGGSNGSPEFEATVQSLRNASAGLPVAVEVNAPFSRLQELYGTASLYLHAMGLDRDPERAPWMFEHFGMTTVEAMAAGAVPFVFAAGGQTEIVTHERNGYLWNSREELAGQIAAFLEKDTDEVSTMRAAARERALDFGEPEFFRRCCEIYRSLGIDVDERGKSSR